MRCWYWHICFQHLNRKATMLTRSKNRKCLRDISGRLVAGEVVIWKVAFTHLT
jgi:hypothetical protein